MNKLFPITLSLLISLSITAQTPLRPFPQHVDYVGEHNVLPGLQSTVDAAVEQFYIEWRNRYVNEGCYPGTYYINFDSDDAVYDEYLTVSEGMGYGMMIMAYMAGYDSRAKEYFDGLFRMTRKWSSRHSVDLMAWALVQGCVDDGDPSSASDGDIDIAYALLLADAQWGSAGEINYYSEAKKIIEAIWNKLINTEAKTIKLGDWAVPGTKYYYSTRPSDFLLDHLRVFKCVSSDYGWEQVVDKCYSILAHLQENYSSQTGLIPDFVINANTNPTPAGEYFLESDMDGHYSYNSCRVPWRIGTDYLLFGDERGKAVVGKINDWLRNEANNIPSNIVSGYTLAGDEMNEYYDNAFMAPFAVGAMVDVENEQWFYDVCQKVINSRIGNYDYYGSTIKMLSLIVISCNYWVPDCSTLSIGEIIKGKASLFSLESNSGQLNVRINKEFANQNFTGYLYDLKGVALQIFDFNNSYSLDLSRMTKGCYLIKVYNTKTGETETKKIAF